MGTILKGTPEELEGASPTPAANTFVTHGVLSVVLQRDRTPFTAQRKMGSLCANFQQNWAQKLRLSPFPQM